ncbi:bifunctional folylpolyglutamate synthase/dihydrofolate synthase [Companilactobacillus ginsenosidimutans]|uniref:tetrahydrofolate synthase n=1 Tax=Companilactobacillus ginsenosidimutans TaxID=1007676 RepID=A0A0H4QID7_9LACO|nr:cyanophycin synthetase [Companilactobacillus ginsenosidimutans]AKP66398.1 folylpolyglutamate synthase [Companilactobacillus ginsenosidimutans]
MFKTYEEAVNYIHSLPRLHKRNTLDDIKQALDRLDNPQNSYPTVHVTGTNGKGSTVNYLANLLETSGKRVGMFTSPFVIKFNERIQINHQMISDKEILDLVNQIVSVTEGIKLIEFEFVTVMGFLYFRDKVDIAIIEVGIGAEHDKTNVITPILSIITSIGLDHEKLIGPTIKDIAIEKSGIIKPQVPVVCGELPKSVESIIVERAKKEKSGLFQLGTNFYVSGFKTKEYKNQFTYGEKLVTIQDIQVYGFEKTDADNSAIAIKAFILIEKMLKSECSSRLIVNHIDDHLLLGREQIVQKDPLVLMDGAHNISAVDNLINSLTAIWPKKDIIILYTGMKDKDRADILTLLSSKVQMVYVSNLLMTRAAKKEDYDLDSYNNIQFVSDYHSKIDEVISKMTENQIFLITGSFYLISELESKFNS